jgi:hypothetical protein
MSMPPLFTCFVCGYEVNPSQANVLRLSLVWLKGGGKTVAKVEDELYKYRHDFCSGEIDDSQGSLF